MKIAVVTTTIREGRNGIQVANWVLDNAKEFAGEKAEFDLVDLKDFNLPLMGMGNNPIDLKNIKLWKETIDSYDGYIFVTAEYNHSPSGVFKNALDYLKGELTEKVVAFVGYGGIGAGRSIEQLKLTLSTLSVATTGISVNLLINSDFVNFSEFKPNEYQLPALKNLLNETVRWTKAFKNLRLEK